MHRRASLKRVWRRSAWDSVGPGRRLCSRPPRTSALREPGCRRIFQRTSSRPKPAYAGLGPAVRKDVREVGATRHAVRTTTAGRKPTWLRPRGKEPRTPRRSGGAVRLLSDDLPTPKRPGAPVGSAADENAVCTAPDVERGRGSSSSSNPAIERPMVRKPLQPPRAGAQPSERASSTLGPRRSSGRRQQGARGTRPVSRLTDDRYPSKGNGVAERPGRRHVQLAPRASARARPQDRPRPHAPRRELEARGEAARRGLAHPPSRRIVRSGSPPSAASGRLLAAVTGPLRTWRRWGVGAGLGAHVGRGPFVGERFRRRTRQLPPPTAFGRRHQRQGVTARVCS